MHPASSCLLLPLYFYILLSLRDCVVEGLFIHRKTLYSDADVTALLTGGGDRKDGSVGAVVLLEDSNCALTAAVDEAYSEAANLFSAVGDFLGSQNATITFASADIKNAPRSLRTLNTTTVPAMAVRGLFGVSLITKARDSWSILAEILSSLGPLDVVDQEKVIKFCGPSIPFVLIHLLSDDIDDLAQFYRNHYLPAKINNGEETFLQLTPLLYVRPAAASEGARPQDSKDGYLIEFHDGQSAVKSFHADTLEDEALLDFLKTSTVPLVGRLTHRNFPLYLKRDILLFVGMRSQYDLIASALSSLAESLTPRLITATLFTDIFNAQAWGVLGISDIPALYVQTKTTSQHSGTLYTILSPVLSGEDLLPLKEACLAALEGKGTIKERNLSALYPSPTIASNLLGSDHPPAGHALSVTPGLLSSVLKNEIDKVRLLAVLKPRGTESFRLEKWVEDQALERTNLVYMKIDGSQNQLILGDGSRKVSLTTKGLPALYCFKKHGMSPIKHIGFLTPDSLDMFVKSVCET